MSKQKLKLLNEFLSTNPALDNNTNDAIEELKEYFENSWNSFTTKNNITETKLLCRPVYHYCFRKENALKFFFKRNWLRIADKKYNVVGKYQRG